MNKKRQTDEQIHEAPSSNGLNRLRAAVLGANDGIVSTAGLVLGVSGAAQQKEAVLLAGIAGLIAGALSMAAGEFVSVSSQRDSEKAFLDRNKKHLKNRHHNSIVDELTTIYVSKGLSRDTAERVTSEFKALGVAELELEKEFGINPDDIANPWQAAGASAVSFVVGAAVPLLAIWASNDELLIPLTVLSVILSLSLTGSISAYIGGANRVRAAMRIILWGIGAMTASYLIGLLLGVSVI